VFWAEKAPIETESHHGLLLTTKIYHRSGSNVRKHRNVHQSSMPQNLAREACGGKGHFCHWTRGTQATTC